MPGATMRGPRPTIGQTNVVDDGISQVTAVRPLAQKNTAYISQGVLDPGRSKKRAVLAVAAGLFMLVGAGIAGVVAYQEFSHQSDAVVDPIPVPVIETQTTTVVAEAPAANAAEAEQPLAEAGAANAAVAQSKPETSSSVKKTGDQAKRPEQAANDEMDMDNLVGPDDEVIVKGDEIHVGKVTIKNGKVYMPDGTVYDAPKTPQTPGIHPKPPPIRFTEEQLRRLTPEQRRKLRMIRQRYPESFPRPTPWPEQ